MKKNKNITLQAVLERLPSNRQNRIKDRAIEYIKEYKSLQEFRKAIGLTQNEIADRQGVNQVNISNLEKRSDMLISTLKNYVESVGGKLEIIIEIENQKVRINNL